jgi:hypothetical protein
MRLDLQSRARSLAREHARFNRSKLLSIPGPAATGEDISTRSDDEILQTANELAGGTKQRRADRLGVDPLVKVDRLLRRRCPENRRRRKHQPRNLSENHYQRVEESPRQPFHLRILAGRSIRQRLIRELSGSSLRRLS